MHQLFGISDDLPLIRLSKTLLRLHVAWSSVWVDIKSESVDNEEFIKYLISSSLPEGWTNPNIFCDFHKSADRSVIDIRKESCVLLKLLPLATIPPLSLPIMMTLKLWLHSAFSIKTMMCVDSVSSYLYKATARSHWTLLSTLYLVSKLLPHRWQSSCSQWYHRPIHNGAKQCK